MDIPQDRRKKVFPFALHSILEQAEELGYEDVVSWTSCGTAFQVHRRDAFMTEVLPRFFKLTKYKSFSRQLNLWGFSCIETGPQRGAYAHPSFREGDRDGCRRVLRQKIARKPTAAFRPAATTSTTTTSVEVRTDGDIQTSLDAANALITADIMAFMSNQPDIFPGASSGAYLLQNMPAAAPPAPAVELEPVSSLKKEGNERRLSNYSPLPTLPGTSVTTNNENEVLLSKAKLLGEINDDGDDWAIDLLDDANSLESFTTSMNDFAFHDIVFDSIDTEAV